jgi:hypothetical protein
MTATTATSPGRLRLRLAAFILLAVALEIGPIVRQGLGIHTNALRSWQMFHKKAVGICDVRYRVQAPDGSSRPVRVEEAMRALRRENRDHFGSPYRIGSAAEADGIGTDYCKKLPAGSALHAVVRCGDADRGWVAQRDGREDLCVRKPDKGRVVPQPPPTEEDSE